MARINSLNGLANNIVQQYMADYWYANGGIMPDWIAKQLYNLKVTNAELNLFTEKSSPSNFANKALRSYLKNLRSFLAERLKANGFEKDFIQEGILKVTADKIDHAFNRIHVQCILTSKTGKSFESKRFTVKTKHIPDSFLQKIWKRIKKP